MSSGSSRADRAVEPTRSQIITVRWRRSALSCNTGPASVSVGAEATPSSSAIARRILRRCPSRTPRSLRSCSVRPRTTERSMALSTNRWAYSLRPTDASHSAMPFMAFLVDPRVVAARAPRDQASAAPPSSVMNARRNLSNCIRSPPRAGSQNIELAMVSQEVSEGTHQPKVGYLEGPHSNHSHTTGSLSLAPVGSKRLLAVVRRKWNLGEQVEPRLIVNGDQPLQQAVARRETRSAVQVIVGGVIVFLADHASVAPPIPGNFSVVSETSPLEPQPCRVHAEAPSDDAARLAPVPQGDELIVVERVAYLSGVDRDRRRRHVLGTQELDDLAEPQFLFACILVGLRPQRTETTLVEIRHSRKAQEALEAKAESHPGRRRTFPLGQLLLRPSAAFEQFDERIVALEGHRVLPKLNAGRSTTRPTR